MRGAPATAGEARVQAEGARPFDSRNAACSANQRSHAAIFSASPCRHLLAPTARARALLHPSERSSDSTALPLPRGIH
jgi:hypothetical protein